MRLSHAEHQPSINLRACIYLLVLLYSLIVLLSRKFLYTVNGK